MKLKNVKEGVRVQYKGSACRPERKGALGTIRGAGSAVPFIQWDDPEHNRTTHNCYRVSAASIDNLRKVK